MGISISKREDSCVTTHFESEQLVYDQNGSCPYSRSSSLKQHTRYCNFFAVVRKLNLNMVDNVTVLFR
ncbi:hypothetical protein Y1Q_0018332 [Alligator mississippiensis]|uniref:Uncharacterized protein n=1 Tax=Alligator mississippiensis TaxID=8496 RepID=A0A151PC77_ALLMI|nr:hypothetical protein Y1Q_0018332 [Alligator mississippiensis]